MAITMSVAAQNAMCNALVALPDGGTTAAEGSLIIMTSGDVTVSTLPLSNPSFGAAASGVSTANAITADGSAVGGTAALHKFVDRDGTEVWRGSVATSGADLNLSSTTVGAGSTVSVSSYTVTQPAA